jgi:hypothetical protein
MGVSDLSSTAAVLSAIEEFDRFGQAQFLELYGFAPATDYVLLFKGRKYDSKAIAGVAHRYQFPEQGALASDSFSGGVSSGGAATRLASLGFEIVSVAHDSSSWSLNECELVTQSYFECLAEQLHGRRINKAALYRSLAKVLGKRSAKSVEYKFQNINAILMEDGLPTLGPPMSNYQNLLQSVVHDHIRTHPRVFDIVRDAPPVARSAEDIFVAPPPPRKTKKKAAQPSKGRITDWAKRDAENRSLGERGERWVIECEKKKLIDAGRADLAAAIIWVSKDMGDGYGYDVTSFTREGGQILIEIKTTNGAKTHRFTSRRRSWQFLR